MSAFDLPTVATPSTQKPDARTVNDSGTNVMRQVIVIGDPSAVNGLLGVKNDMPVESDYFMPVRQLAPKVLRPSFTDALTGTVDSNNFDLIVTGSGQTVNQSGGNLVITAGTTARGETIIRSKNKVNGAMMLKYASQLSQRIANNNFYIELVDVLGDNLAYTINSATSVTVTFPTTNPFTSANVGQFVNLGAITGAAGIQGRYAIASVLGLTVTFTVSGWPSSGSGTLSLFGWNYYRNTYTGTSATAAAVDAQRRGYNSGDTSITVNTTATGHIMVMQASNGSVSWLDKVAASSTTANSTARASRDQNIPDATVDLYLQIRCMNGTTNPASSTTWTIGFVHVEDYTPQYVEIANVRPQGVNSPLPVNLMTPTTIPVSQSGNWFVWSATSYNGDSSTPLGSGASFTGTTRDNGLTPYVKTLAANAYSDQAGTIRWEKSTNNINWYPATADIAVTAGVPVTLEHTVTTRYSRIVYTNGGVAQTTFQLTSSVFRT